VVWFEIPCPYFIHSHPCNNDGMVKRPRDPNQLAKAIVDIATGQAEDTVSPKKRNPSKRKAGGLKGGRARAASLTPEQRSEIAQIAAQARWKKR
jgi:hypothetical protein